MTSNPTAALASLVEFRERAYETRFGNVTAKSIFAYIVQKAGRDGSNCFPSNETISEKVEVSLRQVQRVLKALAIVGLVWRSKERSDSGVRLFAFDFTLLGEDLSLRFAEAYKAVNDYERCPENSAKRRRKNDCQSQGAMSQNDCQSQKNDCQSLIGDCQSFPPHPLNRVPTNYHPDTNQDELVELVPVAGRQDAATRTPPAAMTDAEAVTTIWKLWPNTRRGGKVEGVQCIHAGIADLRKDAEPYASDAAGEMVRRVRTWLAWHDHKTSTGEFVPGIPMVSTWFGKRKRRYRDDEALPPPEAMLKMPDGSLVPESQLLADGWVAA